MHTALLILNLLVSFASGAAAVLALIRPTQFSGSQRVESGERFYAQMYAARAIPFGLAAGLLPLRFAEPAVAWVLLTAGVIQALDALIAVGKRNQGMVIGSSIGAVVHFVVGFTLV